MKKIFLSLILICCMLFPSISFISGCGNNNYDLNNMVIKNWSNYTSIGAGFVSKSTRTNSQMISANATTQAKSQLFGITKDGNYEVITFESEDGTEEQQIYYLSSFFTTTHFTLISYSKHATDIIIPQYYDISELKYLIDNRSGKIFSLNMFMSTNIATVGSHGESKDAFYCGASKWNDASSYIYKFSMENGELKIEQIFDRSKLSDFGYQFIVDNYGNVISKNGKFVITPNGTIKTLDTISPFKALNGYVYAGNKVFNGDGDLVETTFVPPAIQLSAETEAFGTKDRFLIKSNENTNYYYRDNKLYKATFTNEIEYSVEQIALEGYSDSLCKKTLVENDKIYYLTNTEVGFWDIETGLSTLLTNEYIFNDIWTDNQGNLCFNALTSHLDNVEGIINDDNSITVGIFSNGFDVIYIKPINLF